MDHPGRAMTWRDVLLAVVVATVQVVAVLVRGPDLGERPITDLSGLGVLLLVLPALALAARRGWPRAVLTAAALTSGLYYLLDFSDGPGWLALFIALANLAASGDGRHSLRTAGVAIAALSIAWLVAARDIQPAQAVGWVCVQDRGRGDGDGSG